jgi:hypothetical protein
MRSAELLRKPCSSNRQELNRRPHGADTPMMVSNSGTGDLREFALFVVDAEKPFSSPAKMD